MTTLRANLALTGLKILIVEDDTHVAAIVEDYLLELGCQVTAVAHCLDAASRTARGLTMDMAILDINLAGEASFPAAEALKMRKIPFLFMTGSNTWGLPDGLRDAPVLTKPFKLDQLANAMRALWSMQTR